MIETATVKNSNIDTAFRLIHFGVEFTIDTLSRDGRCSPRSRCTDRANIKAQLIAQWPIAANSGDAAGNQAKPDTGPLRSATRRRSPESMTNSLEKIGDHGHVVSRHGQPRTANETRYKHYNCEIYIDSDYASQYTPDSPQH